MATTPTEAEPVELTVEETAAEEAPDEPKAKTTITERTGKMPDASQLSAFLKASGYKESAVDGQNNRTRVFVTTNGGKYQLLKSGKVRTLSGPAYPKEVAGEE